MNSILKRLGAIPTGWYLAVIIAVGTILRFWDIAKSSIWHDEGFTLMLAPQNPLQILARTARDVHPPLYYLALHYWMLFFGTSETAVRSLSAICMIAAIPVSYLLIRRLFNEPAARLAALFVTFGPFAIRYAQEARMYAMVAFLMLLATYFLVRAMEQNLWKWWLVYAVTVSAALYTHYFTIFVILVHIIYVASFSRVKLKTGIFNGRWWLANIVALALFLPWLPIAYRQFTRIDRTFWIPHVKGVTLANTFIQFFTFTDADQIPVKGRIGITAAFALFVIICVLVAHQKRRNLAFLALYTGLGPIALFLISLARPIYVDRYLVFAALAFYSLLGVLVIECWPLRKHVAAQTTVTTAILVIFAVGINNIHVQSDHQMRTIGQRVSQQYQPGDLVMAGEIYTYFDFTYYNHTSQLLKLLAPYGLSGHGESSLLYDRADQIVVRSYTDLHPLSGYVWIIGKTKNPDYFQIVPPAWQQVEYLQAGYIVAKKYHVSPQMATLR